MKEIQTTLSQNPDLDTVLSYTICKFWTNFLRVFSLLKRAIRIILGPQVNPFFNLNASTNLHTSEILKIYSFKSLSRRTDTDIRSYNT